MIAVPEEYSLDDFVPDDDGDDDAAAQSDGTADTSDDETVEGSDDETVEESDDQLVDTTDVVEPAVGTSRWSNEDEQCPDCGTTASRLWLYEGTFCCTDCKEW